MIEPGAAARSHRRAELVAALAAIVCYANILPNDYCDDGVPIVAENPLVYEPGRWLDIWTTDYWYQAKEATPTRDLLYRPVALVTYRLVHEAAGGAAFAQLLTNLLLHAILSALVARLGRHLTDSGTVALTAGVLFAVLPIHSEVVANVVGRADLLASLGTLLALLCQRRVSAAATRGASVRWQIAAAGAAFVALGAKENGAAVAALVPVFHLYWTRLAPQRHELGRSRPLPSLLTLVSLLVPLGVYLALRYHALEGQLVQKPALTKTVNVLVDAPAWQHVLGVLQLWGMYWWKTLWPAVLSVNYSINAVRLATEPADPLVLLGVAACGLLAAASVVAWRRSAPSTALLAIALLISYAPTANALVLIQVFFAERNWYLPSLWWTLLAGAALARVARRPAGIAVLLLVAAGMSARCWIRSGEWRNNLTLYAAAYRDHPQGVGALRLYGQELVGVGDLRGGIELLRRAVEIDLGFTDAHRSLGVAYLLAGEAGAAVRHLQLADMQVPGHPPTRAALSDARARLAEAQGRHLAELKTQTDADPSNVRAAIAWARGLRESGQVEEALAAFRAGESTFASDADWQYEFAVTLVYGNHLDAALERYAVCLSLNPDAPERLVEAAMLLLERRRGDDLDRAWDLAQRADRLAPESPQVMVCRAEILALRGDIAGAIALYRAALERTPSDQPQRGAWEQRARALGN
ncbi:MAG: hypothetical protein HY763_15555 [Planctomycetes bacterium]|nr:hypothetical protein [Planctomycetota bacterium]